MSSGKEEFDFSGIKDILKNALQKNEKSDIKFGFTSVGPHRDDIEIFINQKSAKMFGSQGQQRSSVLALKLSEALILMEKTNKKPVILLDDVLSELDITRQKYILNNIKDWQVFITCCDLSSIEKLINGKTFKIDNGSISEMNV